MVYGLGSDGVVHSTSSSSSAKMSTSGVAVVNDGVIPVASIFSSSPSLFTNAPNCFFLREFIDELRKSVFPDFSAVFP